MKAFLTDTPLVTSAKLGDRRQLLRVSDRIRQAKELRGRWFTARDAAAATTGLTRQQASSTLTNLAVAGELEVDRSSTPRRFQWRAK